jgi:chemotaxis protein MotB
MAKYDTDEIGKPGKPPKARQFPWRLWLFALLMTAGTGAGAYYGWQFRQDTKAAEDKAKAADGKVKAADDKAASCNTLQAKAKAEIDEANKKYTSCNNLLDANNKTTKEQEIQMTALSTNLSASKDELKALVAQRAEIEKRFAAISEIQKQFAKMIDTGQLKVNARRGSLVLSLPSEVLFASGVADVSEAGKMAVLEVGFALKKFPERRFLVIGHTDDVPLKNSTYKDNWELSTARALTVTRVLVQAGMSPKNLVAAGAGENDPVSRDRAKNRRIEIALLPAISELPPLPASLGDDTAKPEGAKAEAEPPKPEAPKTEAPKAEAPKAEAPKAEAPKPPASKP